MTFILDSYHMCSYTILRSGPIYNKSVHRYTVYTTYVGSFMLVLRCCLVTQFKQKKL